MVNFFQDCRDKGLDMVIKLKMPNQEQPEIIMNYNKSIDTKLEYYQKTYTDDLVHKNNPEIQIIEILGTNIPFQRCVMIIGFIIGVFVGFTIMACIKVGDDDD